MPEINSRIPGQGVLRVPLVSLVALALVLGGLTGCGKAGAKIARLTVGTPGPDPYAVMLGSDRQKIKQSPRTGGDKPGDAPGLYGGTRQAASCDPQRLITFLQANPDKARAWAGVHRISTADIQAYVSRLTPVLLRVDTLVTNYGFSGGKATGAPAVLQAGMGVLINQSGVPVVKCNCGNPLTTPDKKIATRKATYTGPKWEGFTGGKVTKILPRDPGMGPIASFVLVDPDATMSFDRPAATTGGSDGPQEELPPTESPTPTGSPTGTVSPDVSTAPSTDPSGVPTDPGTPTDGVPTDTPTTTGTDPSAGPEGPVTPEPEPGGEVPPASASTDPGLPVDEPGPGDPGTT